ncbi:hypothetical protein KL918_005129 [Ogataea parapolymorpha]|nr:hypothetical protein KL918_005129 [Ogataea parapolymorpha]KAG7873312.1 hypothetical protein KL916_002261 [Ogataea parapolymorpha]KAG7886354.1 hypothetical protein KL938_000007 [Ogataea parapolymorpha]
MPRFKGSNSKPPEEFWKLQPTLVKFEQKMKRSESKISKMGRPKHESLWEISHINHQRSRYIYEMFYKKKLITRLTYDWLLNHKYGDAELIAKWRKQGYENLCCLQCIEKSDANSTCICRVPKSIDTQQNPACRSCGCRGCASGD